MIILTGGAGFIGSAILHELNQRGRSDVIVVDVIDHARKERNLAPLRYADLVGISDFRQKLAQGAYDRRGITGVLHLGACSATTEQNWDYLMDNNVRYSQELCRWSADHGVRCVYASSAATYGDGELGFRDEHELFERLRPLNLYGRSKLDTDFWARNEGLLATQVGLRYFNVYGPNEWHKEGMRSVVNKKLPEIQDTGSISLFKSYHPGYRDGGQERDFIYVRDVVAITLWFLDHPEIGGVFNVGSGVAHTWNDVGAAMFKALGCPPRFKYVEMPETLRAQYQYHTRADISKLRSVGYMADITPLEDAIRDYVCNFLVPDKHLGQ